jgi:hypothetical protein
LSDATATASEYDNGFDLRLAGFDAADADVRHRFWEHIGSDQDMLQSLAEYHSADGRHSYYVLHNRAVIWKHPGLPQLIAVHLQRDNQTRTFSFQSAELPLAAMAQSWLIARGCPQDAIRLPPDTGTTAADETTVALEERLMSDGDHFTLLDSYTSDIAPKHETTVLLRAIDDRAAQPFRVLVEHANVEAGTHTLREGAFASYEAAATWLRNRDAPLPPTPPPMRRPPSRPASTLPAPAAPKGEPPRHR